MTPKYIIMIYFDTKLSMFSLAPYTTEEGPERPQKGSLPSAKARQRGIGLPKLIVFLYLMFGLYCGPPSSSFGGHWPPFGPFWGPSAPSSFTEGAKPNMLNLVSK